MTRPTVAVIGAGAMGTNHARVVSESLRVRPGVIVDLDTSRAHQLAERYGFEATPDVAAAAECDMAIIATSTESHLAIALQLLDRGIPLLIEKPIASNLAEMQVVCDMAKAKHVPITCGFVERFNAVLDTTVQVLVDEPMHIVTMRHSPKAERITNSVVYDLLIHDIDLVLRLMGGKEVTKVTAASWSPSPGAAAEIADCTLQFGDAGMATLSASRAGQRKLRSVEVFTPTTLAEVDLLRADLTVYRNVRQEQPQDAKALTYRAETIIEIPFVRHTNEPLARQLDHFVNLVEGRVDLEAEINGLIPPHVIADRVEAACLSTSDLQPMVTR